MLDLLDKIVKFASISSHSLDTIGLARAAEHLLGLFSPLNAAAEQIPLPYWKHLGPNGEWEIFPLGNLLTFTKKREGASLHLLLMGHYDTVYKELFPIKYEGDLLFGPGVADMKGGIILLLELLKWIESSPLKEQISWQVVLNPDEEVGSPGSGPLLPGYAKDKTLALLFEPSTPSGSVVGKRPSSSTFAIEAFGKGGHAGRGAREGRNALVALSEVAVYLASLQDPDKGIVVNPGWIRGGHSASTIPDKASLIVNIRTHEGEVDFLEKIREIEKRREVTLKVTAEGARPARPLLPKTKELLEKLALPVESSFGVSDANLLEAAGLPTLDGLGPTGFNLHSQEEHLLISSLEPRLKKLQAFILRAMPSI